MKQKTKNISLTYLQIKNQLMKKQQQEKKTDEVEGL
jgi:hypothetical protein